MVIGEKLKTLREGQNLSQGDIEKRTGLLRCYISRVENGHTVPTIDTLKKKRALWHFRCLPTFGVVELTVDDRRYHQLISKCQINALIIRVKF